MMKGEGAKGTEGQPNLSLELAIDENAREPRDKDTHESDSTAGGRRARKEGSRQHGLGERGGEGGEGGRGWRRRTGQQSSLGRARSGSGPENNASALSAGPSHCRITQDSTWGVLASDCAGSRDRASRVSCHLHLHGIGKRSGIAAGNHLRRCSKKTHSPPPVQDLVAARSTNEETDGQIVSGESRTR